MDSTSILLILAAVCVIWAVTSAMLIAAALDRRGIKTPFPFIGVLIFRNLHQYGEITKREKGRVGPLFYSYVIPINLTLILVLVAVATRALCR